MQDQIVTTPKIGFWEALAMLDVSDAVAICAALVAVATILVTFFRNRNLKKVESFNSALKLVEAQRIEFIEPIQEKLNELKGNLEKLEGENAVLKREAKVANAVMQNVQKDYDLLKMQASRSEEWQKEVYQLKLILDETMLYLNLIYSVAEDSGLSSQVPAMPASIKAYLVASVEKGTIKHEVAE